MLNLSEMLKLAKDALELLRELPRIRQLLEQLAEKDTAR